ncbi:MAG: carboxypeptidase-like regulatory domain-containing protein, partial [Saprospiraceae bacterium]
MLKGKVFEKGTEEAMVHVQIRLLNGLKEKESTYTNLDGEYVLKIKKKRKYTVICSWESYISDTITLDVLSNDTLYHNFYLERDSSYLWQCPIIITEKPYKSGDLTMTQNQYKVMP